MTRKRNSELNSGVSESAASPAASMKHRTSRLRTRKPVSEPAVEPAPAAAVNVQPAAPERDAIARLAYSYWEARGCQGGSAEEDWLRAESELRAGA